MQIKNVKKFLPSERKNGCVSISTPFGRIINAIENRRHHDVSNVKRQSVKLVFRNVKSLSEPKTKAGAGNKVSVLVIVVARSMPLPLQWMAPEGTSQTSPLAPSVAPWLCPEQAWLVWQDLH